MLSVKGQTTHTLSCRHCSLLTTRWLSCTPLYRLRGLLPVLCTLLEGSNTAEDCLYCIVAALRDSLLCISLLGLFCPPKHERQRQMTVSKRLRHDVWCRVWDPERHSIAEGGFYVVTSLKPCGSSHTRSPPLLHPMRPTQLHIPAAACPIQRGRRHVAQLALPVQPSLADASGCIGTPNCAGKS